MTHLPTLRLHSRSRGPINTLLEALRRWGYCPDARTSGERFNKSIERAVKRFQAQHLGPDGRPLDVDGVVGPATWGALLRPAGDEQRLGLGSEIPACVQGSPDDPRIPICSGDGAGADVHDLLVAAMSDYHAIRRETPMGSNICPWLEPRAHGKPWCSYQVHAWIRSVLGRFIFGGRRGSTRMDLRMAQRDSMGNHEGTRPTDYNMIVTSPRPGDVFLLCDADWVPYHTGLVLRVFLETPQDAVLRLTEDKGFAGLVGGVDMRGPVATIMQTIEGNCANRVAMRERLVTDQVVFWRPFPGELGWTPGLLPNVRRVEARREGTR